MERNYSSTQIIVDCLEEATNAAKDIQKEWPPEGEKIRQLERPVQKAQNEINKLKNSKKILDRASTFLREFVPLTLV